MSLTMFTMDRCRQNERHWSAKPSVQQCMWLYSQITSLPRTKWLLATWSRFIRMRVFRGVKMADLSYSRTNRNRSSFATKYFQRKSLKVFDLHPPLRRIVSFVARIITWKVKCWVTDTQTDTHTQTISTVTLAAHACQGLTNTGSH